MTRFSDQYQTCRRQRASQQDWVAYEFARRLLNWFQNESAFSMFTWINTNSGEVTITSAVEPRKHTIS